MRLKINVVLYLVSSLAVVQFAESKFPKYKRLEIILKNLGSKKTMCTQFICYFVMIIF